MNSLIHPLAVVEDGAEIGDGTRVWHWAHVRKGACVGTRCTIGKSVYIDATVRIGNCVKIQNNVSVYHGVEIGDGVFVGPHVCFTNDLHPRAVNPSGSPLADTDWDVGETHVCPGASIGANSTVIAGITLGAWSMIGAGSVVTRDVPPYALAYGNPARTRGIVGPSGEILSRKYLPGTYQCRNGETIEIKKEWCGSGPGA